MPIELRRFTTAAELLGVAGAFLAEREAEHNLILGLCAVIQAHPEVYVAPWFLAAIESSGFAGARSNAARCGVSIESSGFAGARSNAARCGVSIESSGFAGARSNAARCGVSIESSGFAGARSNAARCGVSIESSGFAGARSGRVVGVAMQTPPHNVLLSEMPLALVDPIADAIAASGAEVPGVLGPAAAAERFVQRRGHPAALEMRQRIFRLERVVAPRPVAGAWRFARADDRELLGRWWSAFHDEASPGTPVEDRDAVVDRWIARIGRTIYLWEDGEPVAMAGAGGETPTGIRIGPVYTPPALRGRGYASNLVAATSQDQLDAGRRFCFLFTDLANPTSNRIYQALGYTPVTDVDVYRFTAPAQR